MEINQLTYLVAIAEESSFSRAAENLGIAQPSLSQQIRKLEDEIGTPLFDRLPRRVVPTAAGEQLLDHARRILAELWHIRSQMNPTCCLALVTAPDRDVARRLVLPLDHQGSLIPHSFRSRPRARARPDRGPGRDGG